MDMTTTRKPVTPFAANAPAAWNVLCPLCGEPNGNLNDGSHLWTRENFDKAKGTELECESCGQHFRAREPRQLV